MLCSTLGSVKQLQRTLSVRTPGRGFVNVTHEVRGVIDAAGVTTGQCTLFVQHTSASLIIQENADPAVLRDLTAWMDRLAPEDPRAYEHDTEGPDDMPAHLRSAVTRSSETIPITRGLLALGTWQAIYVWEHRTAPGTRRLVVHVVGE
jgi:secondary thiamine-phosphate synthase enzyme